jgi:hypothetical protein
MIDGREIFKLGFVSSTCVSTMAKNQLGSREGPSWIFYQLMKQC